MHAVEARTCLDSHQEALPRGELLLKSIDMTTMIDVTRSPCVLVVNIDFCKQGLQFWQHQYIDEEVEPKKVVIRTGDELQDRVDDH